MHCMSHSTGLCVDSHRVAARVVLDGVAEAYNQVQHLLTPSTMMHKHSLLLRLADRGADGKGGSGIWQFGGQGIAAS